MLSVVLLRRAALEVRCLGRLPIVLAALYDIYILPEMSRSAQNQCLDHAPCFSSPNPPSSLSLATNTSKASHYEGKERKDEGMGWTINRSIDNCPMGCSLAENTRPPRLGASATLELVKEHLKPSGFNQPPDRNVETERKNGSTPHASIMQVLYTARIPPVRRHART